MATYQLTSPQGEKYQVNAPDNASQDQVMQYFQQNSGHPDFKQPGLVDRISTDLQNRANMGAEAAHAYVSGKQSIPETFLQVMGKTVLGGAGDIVGETASSLIPQGVKDAASTGAQKVADYIDTKAPAVADTALSGVDAYKDFAKNSPRAARNIEAATDIVTAIPAGRAAKPLMEAGGETANIAGKVLSKTGKVISDAADAKSVTGQVTSDSLKKWSTEAYKSAEAKGGIIAPAETNKWLDSAAQALPQTKEGKTAFGTSAATDFIGRIKELRDSPMTFAGAEEIDKGLGAQISRAYRAGDNEEAARFISIQDSLRNAVSSLPDTSADVKKAKGLWHAAANQRQIETILNNAEGVDNPATAIKNGFRALAKKVNENPRGWSEAEVKAINKAAKTGLATDALRVVGSRLGPLMAGAAGFATGGPAGAIIAGGIDYGLSSAAREGAGALQAKRAAKVSDLLMQRPVVRQAIADATASGELKPKITAQKGVGALLSATGNVMQMKPPVRGKIKKP